MGNLVFQATLGGQVNLVGPNTASTYNLNVPAVSATLATTDANTFTAAQTFSAGTANGVAYLNGSKVLTTGSALVFDGTNLGVGGVAGTSTKLSSSGRLLVTGGAADPSDSSAAGVAINYDGTTGFVGAIQTGVAIKPLRFYGTSTVIATSPTATPSATFDSSGNLGLGVSPSAWASTQKVLEFNNGSLFASSVAIDIAQNAYLNASSAFTYKATGYASFYQQYQGQHQWYNAASGTAGNAITFTQAMTLDASGNLGLGNTAPSTSTAGARGFVIGGGGEGQLRIQSTVTGSASSDGLLLSIDSSSNGYLYNYETAALIFGTSNTERARIDSNGNLLVGATTSNESVLGARLYANGTIASTVGGSTSATSTYDVYSTGSGSFRFYVTLDGKVNAISTTIAAISDQRLKENIRDLDFGLFEVLALKPRRFDWKEGKGADIKDAVGFIAQEFETVFPASVGTSKAGDDGIEYKNICHEELIPTLVKAIQEQQTIIESLTARITALEA